MLQTFSLKNGIKVATYSLPQLKSVFISQAVKGGGIFDTEQKAGVSHFMEHILFKGTPSFATEEDLDRFVETLAGSMNASVGFASVNFWINIPAIHVEDGLRVASEIFFQPLLPADSIDREKGVVADELRRGLDDVDYKLGKFSRTKRYKKGHPFLVDTESDLKALPGLTREDLVGYWEQFFYPKNLYLIVVGGFNPKKIRSQIEKKFGQFKSEKAFPGFPKVTNSMFASKGVFINYNKALKNCYINISFPSINMMADQKLRTSAGFISSILTSLHVSRLYRLLRFQKGLVYSVGSYHSTYPNFGLFYITTKCSLEHLDQVMQIISQELVNFYKQGPLKSEVEFAKNYKVNSIQMQWDHPSNIADWIKSDLIWEDHIWTPDEYAQLVKGITLKDINNFMRDHWELDKMQLILQGPLPNSDKNIRKYSKMLADLK